MAFDYAQAVKDATELVEEFYDGRSAWLIGKGTESGDEWNPTFGAPVNTPVKAVEVFAEKSVVDGTRIEDGRRTILISAEGITIDVDTSLSLNLDGENQSGVIVGGSLLEVVIVKPLNPAGTVVFYELQVK